MSEIDILEAIDILEIPPNQRKTSDIMRLSLLTEHVDFFRKITEDEKSNEVHMSCCQSMTLEVYEEGVYIVKHGEKGSKFYIILKGDVSITIPTKTKVRKTAEENEPFIETNSPIYKVNSGTIKLQRSTEKLLNKVKVSDDDLLSKFGRLIDSKVELMNIASQDSLIDVSDSEIRTVIEEKEVSQMHAGKSFGELALISDRPRAASVVCKNRVVVAVLKKEDFKKILGTVSEKKIEKKVKFLQTIPFFSGWSKLGLYKLSYFFKVASFCKNQKVYKEGDIASDVYIVIEGEFRMCRHFQISSTSLGYSDATAEISHSPINKKRSRKINGQLVIKGNSEMFGYEEILNEASIREHTVVCVTRTAEVYHISREDFISRIPHPETWNMLREKHIRDTDWRDKRIIELKNLESLKESLTFSDAIRNQSPSPTQLNSYRESYDDNLKYPSKYIIKKQPPIITREKYRLKYNHPIRSFSKSTRFHNPISPSPDFSSRYNEVKKNDSLLRTFRQPSKMMKEERDKQNYTPFSLEKKMHTRRRLPPPNFFASPPRKVKTNEREQTTTYDFTEDVTRREQINIRQSVLKQARGVSYGGIRLPKVEENMYKT